MTSKQFTADNGKSQMWARGFLCIEAWRKRGCTETRRDKTLPVKIEVSTRVGGITLPLPAAKVQRSQGCNPPRH